MSATVEAVSDDGRHVTLGLHKGTMKYRQNWFERWDVKTGAKDTPTWWKDEDLKPFRTGFVLRLDEATWSDSDGGSMLDDPLGFIPDRHRTIHGPVPYSVRTAALSTSACISGSRYSDSTSHWRTERGLKRLDPVGRSRTCETPSICRVWWDASTGRLVGAVENAGHHALIAGGRVLATKPRPVDRISLLGPYKLQF